MARGSYVDKSRAGTMKMQRELGCESERNFSYFQTFYDVAAVFIAVI